MTGLVRKALTIAAGLTVVASVASAGVPSPQASSVEAVIVSNASGNPLGASGSIGTEAVPGFEVTVRDINNTPLMNRNVVLDYSATSIRLYSGIQPDGSTVSCGSKTYSKMTPANGSVVFSPRTGGFVNTNSVEVSADGVVLKLVKSRSTDIDAAGANGSTTLLDIGQFDLRYAAAAPAPEVNFNLSVSEVPDLIDLGILDTEYGSAASGAYCP